MPIPIWPSWKDNRWFLEVTSKTSKVKWPSYLVEDQVTNLSQQVRNSCQYFNPSLAEVCTLLEKMVFFAGFGFQPPIMKYWFLPVFAVIKIKMFVEMFNDELFLINRICGSWFIVRSCGGKCFHLAAGFCHPVDH